jgi:hypothetical protein
MDSKRFTIEGYGNVERGNAVFLRCRELDKVDALKVGESVRVKFGTTSANSNLLWVKRER